MRINSANIYFLNTSLSRRIAEEFKNSFEKEEIEITNKDPDIMVVIGGHGTHFSVEDKFPGVPKLFLRHEEKKCGSKSFQQRVTRVLKKGRFKTVTLTKLEARVNGKKRFQAINDINVHYKPPTALRFTLSVDGRKTPEMIGDGLVISTPYGSSAYFSSITGKKFKRGIGIAFNNTTKKQKSRILGKNSRIKVKIIRGPGNISYDSSKNIVNLKKGDVIEISASKDVGRLVKI